MSIAIINGSPKKKKSATNILLEILKKNIPNESAETFYGLTDETKAALEKSDVWVLAFPVYVDGVPSNLLQIMRDVDDLKIGNPNKKVFAIANCGFHEGAQSRLALSVIKNWCKRCGCEYAGGFGIGGCGFLEKISSTVLKRPLTHRIKKTLRVAADNIKAKVPVGERFTSISLPRWAYIAVCNLGWTHMQRMEVKNKHV